MLEISILKYEFSKENRWSDLCWSQIATAIPWSSLAVQDVRTCMPEQPTSPYCTYRRKVLRLCKEKQHQYLRKLAWKHKLFSNSSCIPKNRFRPTNKIGFDVEKIGFGTDDTYIVERFRCHPIGRHDIRRSRLDYLKFSSSMSEICPVASTKNYPGISKTNS